MVNRLQLRRCTVNIFWSLIYGCLVGYVLYLNVAAFIKANNKTNQIRDLILNDSQAENRTLKS